MRAFLIYRISGYIKNMPIGPYDSSSSIWISISRVSILNLTANRASSSAVLRSSKIPNTCFLQVVKEARVGASPTHIEHRTSDENPVCRVGLLSSVSEDLTDRDYRNIEKQRIERSVLLTRFAYISVRALLYSMEYVGR